MPSPTAINEIQAGRDASSNERREQTATRVFRVMYDEATPGPVQAILDQMVRRYDKYQEPGGVVDDSMLAVSVASAPEDPETCHNHLVTIRYSSRWWDDVSRGEQSGGVGATGSRPGGAGGGGEPDATSPAHPLARPPEYQWGFTTVSAIMTRDRDPTIAGGNGRAVRLTNNRPVDPPLVTERKLLTCSVARNTQGFNPTVARQTIDCVNNADFIIAGKSFESGVVKCDVWEAKSEYENGVGYWAERIVFIMNYGFVIPVSDIIDVSGGINEQSKWRRVVLQADTYELSGGKVIPIMFKGGQAVDKPWPLSSTGTKLAEGHAETDLYYRGYVEFPPINFGVFGSL